VRTDDDRQVLRIEWLEKGGPPVVEPEHRGFGSKLIEGSISAELGGEARLYFMPEGLRCEFAIPMESIAADIHQ
jgi:two-component sensor histidine kinase